jgi:hypothetical protein
VLSPTGTQNSLLGDAQTRPCFKTVSSSIHLKSDYNTSAAICACIPR